MSEVHTPANQRWPDHRGAGYSPRLGGDKADDNSRGESEYLMLKQIHIRNFKCFRHLKLENMRRINVIVGDNAAGKTALLEAIFLALGSSTELISRYRAQRGLGSAALHGTSSAVLDSIFSEYFHNLDTTKELSVSLTGDGEETRSMIAYRGARTVAKLRGRRKDAPVDLNAFHFEWKDSRGVEYEVVPRVDKDGVHFPATGEEMLDFFYYAAGQHSPAVENAERFSSLSRKGRKAEFVRALQGPFEWLETIDIEVVAGVATLYATIRDQRHKLPIYSVSGGFNKIVSALLAIANRQRSVVLFDELESGLYHAHYPKFWEALIQFSARYESQLFLTTHSAEWLEALVEAAGSNTEQIAMWRIERSPGNGEPVVRQFGGETLAAGIESGAEVR